ncbi:MAG: MotA/TolQ/ExbB proton channel family protein [Verrucomicrobiota bacterium]
METFIMGLLVVTSIVSVTFIVERALALRWEKVLPQSLRQTVAQCRTSAEVPMLRRVCEQQSSALARLLLLATEHLDWPKAENADMLETRARQEIVKLERGLVVLEITTGIAPLLGLVGTIYGMITLFAGLGEAGDSSSFAGGISLALRATLIGLLVAIPSLIAWSYYTKKVESMAVEMESVCEEFLRLQYRNGSDKA